MAEGTLRVVGVPPCGAAFESFLKRVVGSNAVVTSFDDTRLASVKEILSDQPESYKPFGDLVGLFLNMAASSGGRLATGGQVEAAFASALRAGAGGVAFDGVQAYPGVVRSVVDLWEELRHWGWDADRLVEAAESAEPELVEKAKGLAELERAARGALEPLGREFAADRVWRCMEITGSPTFTIDELVVVVGNEPRPLYHRWLRWAADQGVRVMVVVDWVGENASLFPESPKIAQSLGAEFEEVEGTVWAKHLFLDETAESAPQVQVVSAADPLAECEWAVRSCIAEVAKDVGEDEIGIFFRDAETYAPLLSLTAARLGLNIDMGLRAPLLSNGFASTLLTLLEALASDDIRDLIAVTRSSYLDLSPTESVEIEKVLREVSPKGWNELEAALSDRDLPWLKTLVEWRRYAVAEPGKAALWAGRLKVLADEAGLVMAATDTVAPTKERDRRAFQVLQRSINDVASVLLVDPSEKPMSIQSFAALCREVWQEQTLAAPKTPTGVRAFGGTNGLTGKRSIYALGMLEGTIPARRREHPLLSDRDREALSASAPELEPLRTSFDEARKEREEFARICCSADAQITFSYPQIIDERDNVPTSYIEIAEQVAGGAERVDRPRSLLTPPTHECKAFADLKLAQRLEAPREPFEPQRLTDKEARAVIRPRLDDSVQLGMMARAIECPFRAAAQYALELRSLDDRTLHWALSAVHRHQARWNPDDEVQEDALRKALTEELRKVIDRRIGRMDRWEIELLRSAGKRYIEEWIESELEARRAWPRTKSDQEPRTRLKVAGREIGLDLGSMVIQEVAGYAALRIHSRSAVEFGPDPKHDPDTLRYGLPLLALNRPNGPGVAVEIDQMSGERTLLMLKRRDGDGLGQRATLKIHREERTTPFQRRVIELAERAIEALETADMEAVPGEGCERCPYGELCRSSTEFGEVEA